MERKRPVGYKLVGQEIQAIYTMEEYLDSCADHISPQHVQETIYKRHRVSTVFLGIDTSVTGKRPILFETMIFRNYGCSLNYQKRCSTYQQSLQMHQEGVNYLKALYDVWERSAFHITINGNFVRDKNRSVTIRLWSRSMRSRNTNSYSRMNK